MMREAKFYNMIKNILSILILVFLLIANSNAQTNKSKVENKKNTKPKVTFI